MEGPPVNQRARIPVRWGILLPVCVETVVGPLHHFRWRGGADNNNNITTIDINVLLRCIYWLYFQAAMCCVVNEPQFGEPSYESFNKVNSARKIGRRGGV